MHADLGLQQIISRYLHDIFFQCKCSTLWPTFPTLLIQKIQCRMWKRTSVMNVTGPLLRLPGKFSLWWAHVLKTFYVSIQWLQSFALFLSTRCTPRKPRLNKSTLSWPLISWNSSVPHRHKIYRITWTCRCTDLLGASFFPRQLLEQCPYMLTSGNGNLSPNQLRIKIHN